MSEESKIKVLNLVRWYPNRIDPMPGLFIQRHIEASAIYCSPGVVYTHQIEGEWNIKKNYDVQVSMINNVPTAKIYYKSSRSLLLPYRKLINIIRFFRANKIGIKAIKAELEGIDLIHVHILTRLGIIAMYHKVFKGRQYIVTEHWSRYLDLTGDFKGAFRKLVTKIVVKNAAAVTAVTKNLASAMQKHALKNNNYTVLPNVVDNIFLNSKPDKAGKSKKVNFIHVSCFEDKSKNVSGLLRVIKELSLERDDFFFTMVGDGMDFKAMKDYAKKLKIREGIIKWKGLLEGKPLVKEMQVADMLVIFSNYENFPVVINESLCLGVPVIATRVGGIPERINKSNGILINAGDEKALLGSLRKFIDRKISFNMVGISNKNRLEFSPKGVGNQLYILYKEALAK